MTISSKEFNDLLSFFSGESSSRHIISLALNQFDINNSTKSNLGSILTSTATSTAAQLTPTTTPAAVAGTATTATATAIGTAKLTATITTILSSLTTTTINTRNLTNSLDTDLEEFLSITNAFNHNDTYIINDDVASNDTISTKFITLNNRPRLSPDIPYWLIPCYSIILLFAIVGNVLVISTLVQNRRMRTITNVFLLNLAISDILLGVLCMPFTLVGILLRRFIFGEFLCKFLPFAQATSVAVSSWTLVAISCERYYAICHPLKSRTWQTLSHAYKIIGFIWIGSIICMTPIAVFSQLIPTSRQGLQKCREHWPNDSIGYERSYNIFLVLSLLVLPLIILCVAYILITRTLYVSMKHERAMIIGGSSNVDANSAGELTSTATKILNMHRASSGFNFNISLRCHTRANKAMTTTTMLNGRRGTATIVGVPTTTTTATATATAIEHIKNEDDNESTAIITVVEDTSFTGATAAASATSAAGDGDGDGDGPQCSTLRPISSSSNAVRGKNQTLFNCSVGDNEQQTSCAGGKQGMLLTPKRSASVKTLHCKNNETSTAIEAKRSMTTTLNIPQQRFTKTFSQRASQHSYDVEEGVPDGRILEGRRKSTSSPSLRITEAALRRSNVTKNLESKKRVVKMLFVLVLEFFICWTPLYVINTMLVFLGPGLYEYIDYTSISLLLLLAYSSSCCNPITYCFMNAGFRRAFLDTFKGLPSLNAASNSGGGGGGGGGGGTGRFWSKRNHKSNNGDMNLSMAGNSIIFANSATNTIVDSPRL